MHSVPGYHGQRVTRNSSMGDLAVCGYGSVFFHDEVLGGRGMAWLTFFRPYTRVKVRVTLDASVQ